MELTAMPSNELGGSYYGPQNLYNLKQEYRTQKNHYYPFVPVI